MIYNEEGKTFFFSGRQDERMVNDGKNECLKNPR